MIAELKQIREARKWEIFTDPSYYDMWAVRNIEDKAFTSAIHVMTKEEAEFIVCKLNDNEDLIAYLKEIKRISHAYLEIDIAERLHEIAKKALLESGIK